ncbi:MAG: hypothetical protein DME42_03190 [Verrucomicrobia bacterium]|nr:MAG: hypothetical protein DME42_03190 [Verrucomicrobiota bacterium]
MKVWKTLLLVYRELDVCLPVRRDSVEPAKNYGSAERRPTKKTRKRFHHVAGEREIMDALDSFAGFPKLVSELTDGRAGIEYEIVRPDHALTSLTRESPSRFWPSPDDIRSDLDDFAPLGKYESIFVCWPQRDLKNGTAVPCDAWGLAMGASEWTNAATYAAIANAPSSAWRNEARGEVWLHEWLHGVCDHFARRGHTMPERDADGGELHGYVRSPTCGWCAYYRDLMSRSVLENGRRLGIPLSAWS